MLDALPPLALSVRQPWAWAIFHGKDVENRSAAAVRHGMTTGPICIHAAKGMTRAEYEHARAFMLTLGVECPPPSELVRGAIVGSVDVVRISKPGDAELANNPWYFGECGLVLGRVVELARPIPCSGALGYFTWEKDRVTAIEEALPWMQKWSAIERGRDRTGASDRRLRLDV